MDATRGVAWPAVFKMSVVPSEIFSYYAHNTSKAALLYQSYDGRSFTPRLFRCTVYRNMSEIAL